MKISNTMLVSSETQLRFSVALCVCPFMPFSSQLFNSDLEKPHKQVRTSPGRNWLHF